MNASKENARRMINATAKDSMSDEEWDSLREFLNACERKLPTEASYIRAASRPSPKDSKPKRK